MTLNARCASEIICTLWNTHIYIEEQIVESTHQTLVKLKHIQSCNIYPICNVYMPNDYWEKNECSDSLLKIKELGA